MSTSIWITCPHCYKPFEIKGLAAPSLAPGSYQDHLWVAAPTMTNSDRVMCQFCGKTKGRDDLDLTSCPGYGAVRV